MTSLDYLIPNSIIDQMQLSKFDFKLDLTSTPCHGRWPNVKVTVGNSVIFNDVIVGQQHIAHNMDIVIDELAVQIEYYNKQDNDTLVSAQGEILENQSVTIASLCVNNIDIIKTQIIYNLGFFYQNLSLEKQKYFIDHGFNTGPSHTLYLCENGIWKLNFKFPVMYHFVKCKAFQAPTERWPDTEFLNEIYNLVQEIRILEQQKQV